MDRDANGQDRLSSSAVGGGGGHRAHNNRRDDILSMNNFSVDMFGMN